MKRIHVNIVTFILTNISFLNLLAVSGYGVVFWDVEKDLEVLCYNISLALFTGGVLYFMTSALPIYLEIVKQRKVYKQSLSKFVETSIKKMESISNITYKGEKEVIKDDFAKLTYGSLAKKGSPNTIYDILLQISDLKESLYKDCIPYISAAGDIENLFKLNNLINHKIFSSRREYLSKEFNNIKNNKVEIGALIKSFYDELHSFKN